MTRDRLDLVAPDDPEIERIWRSLETVAQPSYFLSWGWISTWLASHPARERPPLAVLHDGHEVSAAFFLAQRRVRHHLVLTNNALYLNEPAIAHNGILALPTARRSLSHLLDLLPAEWDELHLAALDRTAFDLSGDRYAIELEREELRPYVDLRRPVPPVDASVHVATTCEEALAIYEGMNIGEAFDRRLITERFSTGEIQLLRITRGGQVVGSLFNLVYRGRVLTYRASTIESRACYTAAIAHNARAGHHVYEMPDDALATGADRLVWLSVTRPRTWVSLRDRVEAANTNRLGLAALVPA